MSINRYTITAIINTALERALDDFHRLVHKGEATPEEISKALRHHPDFCDAWDNYCHENEDPS